MTRADAGASSDSSDLGNSSADQQKGTGQNAASSQTPATGDRKSNGGPSQVGRDPKAGSGKRHYDGGGAIGGVGEGRGTGEDPAKKSRGVAPMMLGEKLPDSLKAQEMSGPDQRQVTDASPQSQPGTLSPTRSSPARGIDEPVTSEYQVPAPLRGLVDDYFQQLHSDTDQPPESRRK